MSEIKEEYYLKEKYDLEEILNPLYNTKQKYYEWCTKRGIEDYSLIFVIDQIRASCLSPAYNYNRLVDEIIQDLFWDQIKYTISEEQWVSMGRRTEQIIIAVQNCLISIKIPRCVLDNIDTDGKVDYFNAIVNIPFINNDKGLNEAGTFKLLCPTCDGKIFQDYENLEALKEVPSERMLEEIALKNVLLMLNKRYTEIELYNNLLKESKIPYPFDKKQEVNSLDERDYFWDFNRIKEIMKENGEKCEFKLFYCKHLDYTVPIAFQGAITLYGDLKGNIVTDIYNTSEEVIVKHMHICVFPLDIGSVVFAFYNKADTEYDSFVNQFNELDDDEKMRIISYIIYEYSEDMLTAKKFPHRTWFLNKMEVTFRETTEIFALSKEMAQEMQREKVKALQNIEKDFPCILSEKFAVKK